MRIGIPAETRPGETRVAATPETVKKLAAKHEVIVQAGAGLMASVLDDAYVAAGATIGSSADVPAACAAVSGAITPWMSPLPKVFGSGAKRRAMP